MHLSDEQHLFVKSHIDSPPHLVALQAIKFPGWDMKYITQQIVGIQIAKKKLPLWYGTSRLLYPVRLSLEQCSSQATAKYKTEILHSGIGIDLTAGFGVDTFYFSLKNIHVDYCESNSNLAEICAYNFNLLKATNININTCDGFKHLLKSKIIYNWAYIDPVRRKSGAKVFKLSDCKPNIVFHQDEILKKVKHLLIKASPLLDIKLALGELKSVKEVHVLSVKNECKELLFLLDSQTDYLSSPKIKCVNITQETQEYFEFNFIDESKNVVEYAFPKKYLYEANASIMKAGAFKSIALKFNLQKLHIHSHLYTSDKLISTFPGKVFQIIDVLNSDKKLVKKIVGDKINIACRNYPQSPIELRKKLKIKEGGELQLFATTLMDKTKKLIYCSRVKLL